MPNPTDLHCVRQSVSEIIRSPHAKGLVAAYFDPSRGFAGDMFDGLDAAGLLSSNPPGRFTVDDIAAASLLDVRFGPSAVRALLSDSQVQKALADISPHHSLWDATPEDLEVGTRLWRMLRDIDGIGRTRASKLLARKRPHLIPIVDSVIVTALHLGDETWRPLALVLTDPQLREDINGLRPPHVSTQISTLRLLDVVTWMSHSRSRSAVSAQIAVGATPTRPLGGLRLNSR